MINRIPVRCLIDRRWNHAAVGWEGRLIYGTLVDFTTTNSVDGQNSGQITAGIIITEQGAFQCVPLEFIFAL